MKRISMGKMFHFDAAHCLPGYDGPCKNLHGHRWQYEVILEGEIDPNTGMLVDFNELKQVATEVIHNKLDHSYLNDHPEEVFKNPTAERMAVWMTVELNKRLPQVVAVRLYESPGSWVEYNMLSALENA